MFDKLTRTSGFLPQAKQTHTSFSSFYHHVPPGPYFYHYRRRASSSKIRKPKLALCAYYTIRILQDVPLKSLVSIRAFYRSQVRPPRPPKGDADAKWSHDLYEDPDKPSLSSRLSASASAPRKPDSILAQRALRDATATATAGLSIKGASTSANVVQVEGLVKGTTPADVEVCFLFVASRRFSDTRQAIFRRCGPIISSNLASNQASDNPIVRLTFKQPAHAVAAVAKFDKQPADGRILHVAVIGVQSVGLSGRLGGMDVVNENGSVDVLMGGDNDAGTWVSLTCPGLCSNSIPHSKLRSDSIMNSDPRATVLVAPPGADPKAYSQQNNSRQELQRWQRGGRKGGRGGRRGGGAGGGAVTMDVD